VTKHNSSKFSLKHHLFLNGALGVMMAISVPAVAQDADEDEIVVTGTRAIIQDAIALKRESNQIVDGLSAGEIGDIPALSIGEALETVTGIASHRENGGATEVSIRGLGPYLSSTVINGREATNGSGDRSVNFSQFPSELMNKLAIFKTQDASQIEGGVAGQIQLETIKPLDYAKRRFQVNLKGNVNPDQLDQVDTLAGDFGYRGTVSYVDQFDVGGGSLGISIGGQRSDISQPEQEIRSTSNTGGSSFACLVTAGRSPIGITNDPVENGRDCEDVREPNSAGGDIGNIGIITELNPLEPGDRNLNEEDAGRLNDINFLQDFVFVPSQRHYRQNDTRDERDALFGAVQWQPNDRLDINLDVQWSERIQSEQRNDLTFNGQKRNDTSLDIGTGTDTTTFDSIVYSETGAVSAFVTDSSIEVQGDDYERKETYIGGGFNLGYDISEDLTMTADVSFSETERTEQGIQFRFQSDQSPVIAWNLNTGIPQYTLSDGTFDVTDHGNFVDRLRVRIDNDLERRNTSTAGRLDFVYDTDWGAIDGLQMGVRYSELEYLGLAGGGSQGRETFELRNDRESVRLADGSRLSEAGNNLILDAANQQCRTDFAESNFLSSAREGALVTNIDDNGGTISETNSWATFNASCLVQFAIDSVNAVGGDYVFGIPTLEEIHPTTIDVTESVFAAYMMANYETTLDGLPMRGNVGVRVVDTSVNSVGYRGTYSVVTQPDGNLDLQFDGGNLQRVEGGGGYTTVLPSANAIVDINDDLLLRAGIFRGLSRADPADMGFSRTFNENSDDDVTTLDDLISSVNASGNPNAQPLTSWNFDVGVEWYPDEDSIFAVSTYYKSFKGGFENAVANETYQIDGQSVTLPVTLSQTNEEGSGLFGVEFTGSHRFSYLPGALSGLGAKFSYNYAVSDFEFEDSLYGVRGFRDANGDFIRTHRGIVAPASIPGLSEHVFAGQIYYQIGNLDLQGLYKYRSEYFQPFTSNGTRIRYVGDVDVFEARASYRVNDSIKLSVEAINLFDEPKKQYKWVPDDLYEVNYYGPRVFFGIQGKF